MKFGLRTPSLRKRIAARTSWKRAIRHSVGFKTPKGYGWLSNPKRAAYNRVYSRTSRGCAVALALWASMLGVLVAASLAWSCGGRGAGGSAGAPTSVPSGSYATELQLCADLTNQLRASVGLRALSRSEGLDEFAAKAAENDGTAHASHQYYLRVNGSGVSLAENEIPWWSLTTLRTVKNVVQTGLQGFWDEGPGGGHHQNMVGPYTQIGCGLFVNGDEVTVTEEFR